jgi:hypothetical protein
MSTTISEGVRIGYAKVGCYAVVRDFRNETCRDIIPVQAFRRLPF